MSDRPTHSLTNRWRLLTRGAAISDLAVASTALAPPLARAQDEAEGRVKQIIDRGRLIAGTGSTNPSWHYEDENGNLVGFDIDMAKLLAGALLVDNESQRADPEALGGADRRHRSPWRRWPPTSVRGKEQTPRFVSLRADAGRTMSLGGTRSSPCQRAM